MFWNDRAMSRTSQAEPDAGAQSEVALGLFLGFLGVACFSLTLPATVLALESLSPWFIALGRAALAGILAAAILAISGGPRPSRHDLLPLAVAAAGVVFGFPLFTSWAMQHVPSAHGGVVLGILPLMTALFGAVLSGERPSAGFWVSAALGSAVVVVFSLREGGGRIEIADLALVAAVASAALGYAEGARIARRLGAWQTICWALVLSLPLTLPLTAWSWAAAESRTVGTEALLGFLYVALGRQLFGFFAWYRGLAIGGTARVSQMQLLQPFLNILAGAVLLGERVGWETVAFALAVSLLVGVGRRMPIRQRQ